MTQTKTYGAYVSDYAREHDIPAEDMVAIINSDDKAPRPLFSRSRMIRTGDGDYFDAYYSRDYLDLVATHCKS